MTATASQGILGPFKHDEEPSICEYPGPIDPDQQLVLIAIKGDPVPAARPRVLRSGGAYYPKRYGKYRDHLFAALKTMFVPFSPTNFVDIEASPEDRRYGVRAFFYRKTKQRTDPDNLLKSILDAGTGILWLDDAQVEEVFGRIKRSDPDPRVEILIYELSPAKGRLICKECGKDFDSYHNSQSFCSWGCRIKALAGAKVSLTCKQCGRAFQVLRCMTHLKTPGFCSQPCSIEYWSKQRRMAGSTTWRCIDCGAQVSRKEYKRCHHCQILRRRGIDPKTLPVNGGEPF